MMVERVLSLEGGYVAPWFHCASWSCQRTHRHYIGLTLGTHPAPTNMVVNSEPPRTTHAVYKNLRLRLGLLG